MKTLENTYRTAAYSRKSKGQFEKVTRTKVHLIRVATEEPVCGTIPARTMYLEEGTPGVDLSAIDCAICSRQAKVIRERSIMKDRM